MDLLVAACKNFILILNTEKTVVMHQPPYNAAYNVPHITVNGTRLETVDTFTYLVAQTLAAPRIKDEVPPTDLQS
nr:unnamed protein product [Spirometra erinaceieuropaei]